MTRSLKLPVDPTSARKAIYKTLGKRPADELFKLVYGRAGWTGFEWSGNVDRKSATAVAARETLQEEQADLERQAGEKLKKISPRALLRIDPLLAEVERRNDTAFMRFCGLDRFIWWVGATAVGDSEDPADVASLAAVAARWLVNRRLLEDLEPRDADVEFLVSLNPKFEDTRRIAHSEIRFTWVTRLICEEMAKAVAGKNYADKLPELTISAVQEVMAVLSAIVGDNYESFAAGLGKSPQSKQLAQALSIKAGSLSKRSELLPLLFTREVETHPFIDLDPEVVPAAPRTANARLEVALLELVRHKAGSGARGRSMRTPLLGA